MKRLAIAFAALAAVPLVPVAAAADDRLAVVATFSILGDFAARVGGERIDLTVLVGPDSDPHVYEPKPADAMALAKADVILVNGLAYEGYLHRLVSASGAAAEVVELAAGVRAVDGDGHDHHAGGDHDHDDHDHDDRDHDHDGSAAPDPHAWQSVANARRYVDNVIEAFCRRDTGGCPTYRANGAAYLDELEALDREIRDAIATIPAERRVVVVTHNSFRYFEQAYGLRFIAPQGISTEAEASAADVAALIREIRAHKAVAVFAENISDGRLIRRIAAEAGITPGGTLYSDALSPPDGPAPTYVAMMRHNLRVLMEAIAAGGE